MSSSSGRPARRVGLFGGSFDPVHRAHLALAREALDELHLDELRWVPAGQPWQKARHLTPAGHREAMVRLAIAGEPRFVLERCELERSGPSFTLDTVRELQAAMPGVAWFLVIGQDQFDSLHTWQRWKELLSRVTLAVAQRPGAAASAPAAHAEVLRAAHVSVALPPMDVSSSQIRERVESGLDILDLVPAAVASYIDQHRLYAGPPQELNGHS